MPPVLPAITVAWDELMVGVDVPMKGDTQNPTESIFVIPQENGRPPMEITGFSGFITTKAAAYVFLPSITAIQFIANL